MAMALLAMMMALSLPQRAQHHFLEAINATEESESEIPWMLAGKRGDFHVSCNAKSEGAAVYRT
jgi:hypothetical protein